MDGTPSRECSKVSAGPFRDAGSRNKATQRPARPIATENRAAACCGALLDSVNDAKTLFFSLFRAKGQWTPVRVSTSYERFEGLFEQVHGIVSIAPRSIDLKRNTELLYSILV